MRLRCTVWMKATPRPGVQEYLVAETVPNRDHRRQGISGITLDRGCVADPRAIRHNDRKAPQMLLLLGFISAAITLVISVILSVTGVSWEGTLLIVWCLAWTVFWFWLASISARKRAERRNFLLQQPCSHCGAVSNPGYRVCASCSRVKQIGL